MKILCFGDSNTYGYDPGSFFAGQYGPEYRWVDQLAKKLGCDAVNAGENGREIPWREADLLRFDLMLTNQRPIDLLIVMLGGNDLLQGNCVETVVNRMERFLLHIDLEKSKILVVGPPPMKLGAWVPTQVIIDKSRELNKEYKKLSQNLGVRFVDSGVWDIPLTFDGVHLTGEGHKAFSEGLYNHLNEGE